MNISYNWIKELVEFDGETPKVGEIAKALTSLGLEVERIESPAEKYEGFYVAHVLEKTPHPDADKLNLCRVMSASGEQTVVCGAPNVDAGQKVVLGTEGAVVPSAGFALSRRKIRGVESNGMICSQSELELGDDHDGIWVLPEDAETGKPLADYLGLNDSIIEIAITPNRADCTGHIGVARELAAFFGGSLRLPDASLEGLLKKDEKIDDLLAIEIDREDQCPRYAARIVRDVKVGDSPSWLKARLEACGVRSINNIVDVTNYLLMLTGQPLHAFDYAKVCGQKIVVGNVADGTKFTTLDGKERKLDSEMLLIKDVEGPVAVAGVMGGEDSEITDASSDVLIESAYFEPGTIRKTGRKLGIHSDASYRFERGIDYANVPYVGDLAAKMIAELGGGYVVDGMIDAYPNKQKPNTIELRYERVSSFLGEEIGKERINGILTSLGFEVNPAGEHKAEVLAPTWRVDMELEVDLIEEVARVYGYDNLPSSLAPSVDFSATATPEALSMPEKRTIIRDMLIGMGFRQAMHVNQGHPEHIEKFGIDYVKITNPLGSEMGAMRTSLAHSMMKTVHHNHRLGNKDLKLFEIGKVFWNTGTRESFVQGFTEREALCIAISGESKMHWSQKSREMDFYDLKGIWESLSEELGVQKVKTKATKELKYPYSADSLSILEGKNEIGRFGRISKEASKVYDLEEDLFVLEVDLTALYSKINGKPAYSRISQYPDMQRDLAFLVPADLEGGKLMSLAQQNAGGNLKSIEIFDIFEDAKLGDKKSVAISLTFNSSERTLTDEEVKQSTDKIVKAAAKELGAELRK